MLNISISSSHYGNNFLLHQQSKWPRFFFYSTKKKKEVISNTNPFRRENALNPMENSWILFCLSLVSNLSGNTGMTHAEETLALYLCRSYNSGTTIYKDLHWSNRHVHVAPFFKLEGGGGQRKKDRVVLFSVLFGFFYQLRGLVWPPVAKHSASPIKVFSKTKPID